jgi:putative copper export protein
VTVPANGQAAFVANIPTGSSVVRPKARDFKSPPWNWYLIVIALLSLLGLASVGHGAAQPSASLRKNQQPGTASRLYRQRVMRVAQACSLLLMLALAISACGSGGGGGSSVTQPNTYSFTVTATAGGTTRTIALTLTVQ